MKNRLLLLLFTFALSLNPLAHAFAVTPAPAGQMVRTKSAQVPLTIFGTSAELKTHLPNQFQVLVWNIHKGTDKNLLPDYSNISRFAHLALFQEAIDQETFAVKLKKENTLMAWAMARAFATNGHYTGVATGSQVVAQKRLGFRTQPTEPVTNTPKTMLLSDYLLENGKTLRVLNVHGINFVVNSQFEIQVRQILGLIADHKGPLLVAGDFNTWNGDRKRYLIKSLASLGLKNIDLEKHGLLDLDHVFVRDLNVIRKDVLKEIDSSDHKPILVELESLD